MDEAAVIHAVERIEAALARLDTVVRARDDHDEGLRHRHEALKRAVAGSLADIDALIACTAPSGEDDGATAAP